MKLALLGCGLLGGSVAAAWRRSGAVQAVTGYDRDAASARRGRERGILDTVASSAGQAMQDADCIVLATPVGAMGALFEELARHAPAGALITDVGSTKVALIAQARAALGGAFARYVPAHPIAGGALPGIEHASADLFSERWVITTPQDDTDADALERIEDLWAAAGATVERMGAGEHDAVFAAISHLPHLLAFALVDQIAGQSDGARKLQFAGAGFRDFSRIAASDPVMWRDVALANRAALGAELAAFRRQLDVVQAAVDRGDGEALRALFERASRVRREQRFGATLRDEYRD